MLLNVKVLENIYDLVALCLYIDHMYFYPPFTDHGCRKNLCSHLQRIKTGHLKWCPA